MGALGRRIEALEAARQTGFRAWHRIVVNAHEGQTEGEAFAAYEAEHGPLGDDPCFIVRVVASPHLQGA